MSDTQQGPGWWQASDGKWYPPEQHPSYQPPPPPPPSPPSAQTWGAPSGVTGTAIAAPQPAKGKGRGCLIAVLVVVGLFVLLVVIAAIAGGGGSDDSADSVASDDTSTTSAAAEGGTAPTSPPPTDAPAADQGTRENPYPAGVAQNIGDGWTVRVAGYNPNGNELVAAANMFNEDPGPGQQYVVVQVEATYDGEDTRTAFDLTLELLGSGGVTIPLSFSMCVAPEPQWSSLGEAYPGGTLSGYLCALVPSAEVGSFVMIAEPTLALSGTKAFFALG